MGRIQDVDVDRQVERKWSDTRANALDHASDATPGLKLVTVYDSEAQRRVPRQIVATVERTSDADVHGARVDEQALLRGSSKRRAVGVGGAEVRVPCIQVRIEVDERDRSRAVIDRPKERKRDR